MLSVVICAYNEEKNLPRVVKSVRDLADEVILVDTQSTDNTVQVARKLGCLVFHHKNTKIIEPVRNFAVSQASGDWILFLDADEQVSPLLKAEIKQAIIKPDIDVYQIPRQNIIFGKWIKSDHWWPDYVFRLYKKGSLVWQDSIHSQPKIQGRQGSLVQPLIHYNYQSVSQFIDKLNRYTDIQSKQLISQNINFHWSFLVTRPASEFFSQYYSRGGYRDGLHGLALAGLQAISEFVISLKIWESGQFVDQKIKSSDLHPYLQDIGKSYYWWRHQVQIDSSAWPIKQILKIKRRLSV